MPPHLDRDTKLKIKTLGSANWTPEAIQKHLSLEQSRSTIRRVIAKPLDTPETRGRKRKLDEDASESLVTFASTHQNATLKELAVETGLCAKTVKNYMNEAGLATPAMAEAVRKGQTKVEKGERGRKRIKAVNNGLSNSKGMMWWPTDKAGNGRWYEFDGVGTANYKNLAESDLRPMHQSIPTPMQLEWETPEEKASKKEKSETKKERKPKSEKKEKQSEAATTAAATATAAVAPMVATAPVAPMQQQIKVDPRLQAMQQQQQYRQPHLSPMPYHYPHPQQMQQMQNRPLPSSSQPPMMKHQQPSPYVMSQKDIAAL